MRRSDRVPQPTDGTERSILLGWLAFHRNALEAKCAGLSAEQLAERAVPPSRLSLLGLVRHMAEMENAFAVWALGPKSELRWVWGEYPNGGPEPDFDCDATMVDESLRAWHGNIHAADTCLDRATLDEVTEANGHTVRWNLHKLIAEYARHNGHADFLRERIDGETGE